MSDSPPKPSAGIAAFQEAVKKMRAGYLEQLPLRLREMHEKLAECQSQPDSDTSLEELHRQLHTIAGTAGTFGLDKLGAQARQIELALAQLQKKKARSAADFETVARQLDCLAAPTPGA